MSFAFEDDLPLFFTPKSEGGFAVAATYDGATTVNVIFDRAYLEPITGIAGTNPVALVQASAVDADPAGKSLVINGTTYTIARAEPQDDGAVLLLQLRTA